MLRFEKTREKALLHYLRRLGHREPIMNYRQIQGLLYAVACSPEVVPASEWLDLIWDADEPPFEDQAEVATFFQLLVELSQHISAAAGNGLHLPFAEAPATDLGDELADWCDGLLMGHQYLENVWLLALAGLEDERLRVQIEEVVELVAMLADWDRVLIWRARENPGGEDLGHEDCFRQLRRLLSAYHSVHALWSRGPGRWGPEDWFRHMQPVAAEAECLCGSGLRFRDCCLH